MSTCSVIVTIRDEPAERIEAMVTRLASSLNGDTCVELVVAAPAGEPGASAAELAWPGPFLAVANPSGERSTGLNRAARAASGEHLVRVDARSLVPDGYIARCSAELDQDPETGVVGGHQVVVPGDASLLARAIARALGNPLVGGAPAYRRPEVSGEVDTVYLGAYRRADFLRIGGYDERLRANEDFDLCRRFARAGKRIRLIDGLDVEYRARTQLLEVWKQYYAFGQAKAIYWRLRGGPPEPRQVVALAGGMLLAAMVPGVLKSWRRGAFALAAGAGVLLAVDELGNPPASPAVRASAAWISGSVVMAWMSGVLAEGAVGALRRSPR